MSMYTKHLDVSVNWNRVIHIDEVINEQLVRRLIPDILKMRQASNDPITVAINSPGGSLASLETILGLLTGPTQFAKSGSIVTVVTNKAYSAAANLLAMGNYSVALPHTSVLCHDVRFGEMADVTPSKALSAAKSLQDENDRFALKLANHVVRRLVWVYLDLQGRFSENNKRYSGIYQEYSSIVPEFSLSGLGERKVDIASFATALYGKLSLNNDILINGVMSRLAKWILLTRLTDSYPTYRTKGARKVGLLDGAKQFYKELGAKAEWSSETEGDLKLMLTLMLSSLAGSGGGFERTIDDSTRNYNLIKSMNDESHRNMAMRMMLRHRPMFFDVELDELDEKKKKGVVQSAMPHAQLFWLFCVSLCRELFEGEHVLSPNDSQLLGLVDEVAGGGHVESRREFRVSSERASEKK